MKIMPEALQIVIFPAFSVVTTTMWVNHNWQGLTLLVVPFLGIRLTMQSIQLNYELQSTLKELRETQARLIQSEKMAGLGKLVGGMAHELNNPLNFLSMQIPLLKESVSRLSLFVDGYETCLNALPNDLQNMIFELRERLGIQKISHSLERSFSSLQEGTNRSKQILEQLRMFARTEVVGEERNFVDVKEALEATLAILSPPYAERIRVHREIQGIPKLWCSPSQFNQLLASILSNAFEAISGEGDVSVYVRTENEKLVISIYDSGPGIPKAMQDKIFDPFFTTKEVGQGTGLGLSVVYGIIQEHHGEIRVESAPAQGTAFHLIFPLH